MSVLDRRLVIGLAWSFAVAGCAGQHRSPAAPRGIQPPVPADQPAEAPAVRSGLLVMAHGGSAEWNASVEAAVAPLAKQIPTEIAFGMANPLTLQQAVDRLESAGVRRIAVVRLFVSGTSFLHRTEYLLGKRPDPPSPRRTTRGAPDELLPVETFSQIEIDTEGLVDAVETGAILRSRALELSRDPTSEVVLILGHGNGDEAVNRHLLRGMWARAELVRAEGFGEVRVETLREDWAAAREEAEARIRAWVTDHVASGRRVLVIPFRLSGFGPYEDVLDGLEYEADGLGLLPHEAIGGWLRRRTAAVFCANGWQQEAVPCSGRPAVTDSAPLARN